MPVSPPKNAKKVWQGVIHTAWQWDQELYDGSHTTFECLTRPDTATVLAFIDHQTVILTKQEQPGRPSFLDVSGGRVDAGETSLQGAMRELEEETGYSAAPQDWLLWQHHAWQGYMLNEESFFLARNVQKKDDGHADPGERIQVVQTSWTDLVQYCLADELRQTGVMNAILRMQFNPEDKQRLQDWLKSI